MANCMRYLLVVVALPFLTWAAPAIVDKSPGEQGFLEEGSLLVLTHLDSVVEMMGRVIPRLTDHLNAEIAGDDGLLDLLANPASCAACMLLAGTANAAIDEDLGFEDVRDDIVDTCTSLLNGTGILEDVLCAGVVDNYGPSVFDILESKPAGAREVCTFYQSCSESEVEPTDEPVAMQQSDWPRPFSTPRERKPDWKENSLKFVHLTDIHVDEEYLEGAAEQCGLPVCCREEWEGEGSAGYWGSYRCNVPPRTIEAFLDNIAAMDPQPSFLIYTGDSPPHHLWEETLEGQISVTRWVAQTLQSHLPQMDTYPAIGNHEYFPSNMFCAERPDSQEMQKEFARVWQPSAKWSPEQRDNVEYAGFYTMEITPGLRILSFNTNYGYNMNWYNWLNVDHQDFRDTQQFIRETLAKARDAEEKVILAYHHPSGAGSLEYWNVFMEEVVLEYSDIITLQLSGHTHNDEFRLYIDPEDGKAKNVQYVGGTMTSLGGTNPNARMFYLDPVTFEVVEYEHFALDIIEGMINPSQDPPFYHVYTASEEYDMPDLSPASWYDLTFRFETDTELFDKYYANIDGNTGVGGSCATALCRRRQICRIRSSNNHRYEQCLDEEDAN